MNKKILWTFFSILLKLSNGDNNGINEGASTSHEPSDLEKCELQSYAESVVRLILAEDARGGSLADFVENRWHELEVFHDDIISNFFLAQHGARGYSGESRREVRYAHFIHYLENYAREFFNAAYMEHFRLDLRYDYNSNNDAVMVRQQARLPTDSSCLCNREGTHNERLTLNETFTFPEVAERPVSYYQIDFRGNDAYVSQVSHYNIIPLALISRFFNVWLAEHTRNVLEKYENNCVVTLHGRLKRSLQKLVMVRIKYALKSKNIDLEKIISKLQNLNLKDEISEEEQEQIYGWLTGNIFLGPVNRGPFQPEVSNGHDLSRAFEYNIENIIGRDRYNSLMSLNNDLRTYCERYLSAVTHERLLTGLKLFFSLIYHLEGPITRLNINEWEERVPSTDELDSINFRSREEVKTKKFWFVKKDKKRDPRSIIYDYDYAPVEEQIKSREILKFKWSEFVMSLMKISMNARSRQESMSWSCKLDRLYHQYLLNKESHPSCYSFDKYLLREIMKSADWEKCNNRIKFSKLSAWCQAWKRITAQFNTSISETIDYGVDEVWSDSYLKDTESFMQWLSTKLLEKKECKPYNGYITYSKPLPIDPLNPAKPSSTDVALCYFSTLIVSVFSRVCNRTYGKFRAH